MKKQHKLLLTLMALVFLPSLVYATSTAPIKNKEQLQTIREKMGQKKEDIQNRVQERRVEIQNKIEDRIILFVQNVIRRHEAAAERLSNIAQRLETRITKMETEGFDQSKAKNLLDEAKIKIEKTREDIFAISNWQPDTFSSSVSSTSPGIIKNKYAEVKVLIEKSKETLKEAHAALAETIKNINKVKN